MIIRKIEDQFWLLTPERPEDIEFKQYIENIFEQIDLLNGKKHTKII